MLETLEIHQDPPKLRTFSNVVLVSAMQQEPCVAEGGDELHFLSVQNKQVGLGHIVVSPQMLLLA